MSRDFLPNQQRFTGFAGLYDQHRASPPASLDSLLIRYAGINRPRLVVDLGSGTGLSTRYWADRAERVIGIEPTDDMRKQAEAGNVRPNVFYQKGYSHATGLSDATADVVICMQALHWMEPAGTFREVARILRPGGVFAACDYDWPPSVGSAKVENAYDACIAKARRYEEDLGLARDLQQWDKAGHLERMRRSGAFAYTREWLLSHTDIGNAERLIGVLLSQGFVQQVLQRGISEAELGLTEFRRLATTSLGEIPRVWHWSARVRLGVKSTG
jgi:SAM-dependent methyltransferase